MINLDFHVITSGFIINFISLYLHLYISDLFIKLINCLFIRIGYQGLKLELEGVDVLFGFFEEIVYILNLIF